MTKFIQLNRKFSLFHQNDFKSYENTREYFLGDAPLSSSIQWNELLALQENKIVILAEAGTGKTQEFKYITQKLRTEGKTAFFCRIEILADSQLSFNSACDIGCEQALLQWKNSQDTAYFFLDSVDEAKLLSHKFFEIALRKFVESIGKDNLPRAKVFVSSRFTEWQSSNDFHIFCQIFNIPEEKSQTDTTDIIYTLTPLDDEQIHDFLCKNKIDSPSSFIQSIKKADLLEFSRRPQDLIDLIEYWKSHQNTFDRYIKMVEYNIEQKLLDRNLSSNRKDQETLSYDNLKYNAQYLAAAVTFTKKSTLRISSENIDNIKLSSSVNPKFVLQHLTAKQITELLTKPLFDEAI